MTKESRCQISVILGFFIIFSNLSLIICINHRYFQKKDTDVEMSQSCFCCKDTFWLHQLDDFDARYQNDFWLNCEKGEIYYHRVGILIHEIFTQNSISLMKTIMFQHRDWILDCLRVSQLNTRLVSFRVFHLYRMIVKTLSH